MCVCLCVYVCVTIEEMKKKGVWCYYDKADIKPRTSQNYGHNKSATSSFSFISRNCVIHMKLKIPDL